MIGNKRILLCFTTLVTVFLLLVTVPLRSSIVRAQSAEPGDGPRVAVVLTDVASVGATQRSADLFRSFLGLATTLQGEFQYAFVDLRRPDTLVGPVSPSDPAFDDARGQLEAMVASSAVRRRPDLFGTFTEVFNLLSSEKAGPGSVVYLVVGSQTAGDFDDLLVRLTPMLERFQDSGWSITALTLPGLSPEAEAWAQELARATGGQVLSMSSPRELKEVTDAILRRGGSLGALAEMGGGSLSADRSLTVPVSFPPGTGEATLVIFRENTQGTLRLSNPAGLEAAMGDRTASYVVETPYAVVWRLLDPAPGEWSVAISGLEGDISVWRTADNKYSVVLETQGPLPLNEPNVLLAYITDGRDKVFLDGIRLFARLTTPQGQSLVYEMNDQGQGGDAIAGDGYYSVQLPPLQDQGEYSVALDLTWPDLDYTITTQARFATQVFPALEITRLKTEDLELGERTKVATVFVQVDGQPYAIAPEQLTADLASPEGAAKVEVVPQRTFGDGRAWMYDVYVTLQEQGLHQLVLRMALDYNGRSYIHSAEPVILAPVPPPPPPPVEAPVQAPRAQRVAPAPSEPQPAGFPWWVLVFPGAVVLALVALLVYSATRTRPFGYLYNDRNELVVDFSRLRRHPLAELLFKDTVSGEELKVPGLEGVTFKFQGRSVRIISRRPTPSVRVNNQPVVDEMSLPDRAWIGASGKVYSYLVSPPQPQAQAEAQPQPQGGDD